MCVVGSGGDGAQDGDDGAAVDEGEREQRQAWRVCGTHSEHGGAGCANFRSACGVSRMIGSDSSTCSLSSRRASLARRSGISARALVSSAAAPAATVAAAVDDDDRARFYRS